MPARIELIYNAYANFDDQVLAAIRQETFGRNIGQNSWATIDEYNGYIKALRLDSSAHVLEVASGAGGPALYLAQRVDCRVTGIDVNRHGIATATRSAARAGLAGQVIFKVADANAPLAFADGAFDALLCIDSMNHFPDRMDALQEWRRVLKPGGRAVFTDPMVITGAVTGEELAHRGSLGQFVFLPRGVNEELIVKAGFRIVAQTDVTESAALITRRWREARRRFCDDLIGIEGEERFFGVQNFLGAVHTLTNERRLSRIEYLVEKPAD